MIKYLFSGILFLMSSNLYAQNIDTSTILIYDSLTHTFKKVDLDKYTRSQFVRELVTGEILDEAEKVKKVKTTKKYKITKNGNYRYNYGGYLKPVTELTFYYKIIEDDLLPRHVDALDWLNMSARRQKSLLKKYNGK